MSIRYLIIVAVIIGTSQATTIELFEIIKTGSQIVTGFEKSLGWETTDTGKLVQVINKRINCSNELEKTRKDDVKKPYQACMEGKFTSYDIKKTNSCLIYFDQPFDTCNQLGDDSKCFTKEDKESLKTLCGKEQTQLGSFSDEPKTISCFLETKVKNDLEVCVDATKIKDIASMNEMQCSTETKRVQGCLEKALVGCTKPPSTKIMDTLTKLITDTHKCKKPAASTGAPVTSSATGLLVPLSTIFGALLLLKNKL